MLKILIGLIVVLLGVILGVLLAVYPEIVISIAIAGIFVQVCWLAGNSITRGFVDDN